MTNSQTLSIATHGGRFNAYVSEPPPETDCTGAMVLVHEIFGVTRKIRGYADDYAGAGFRVIVPDLFWRTEPNVELGHREPDLSHALARVKEFDDALALADVSACVQWLRAAAPALPVSLVGFCLGGKLAVAARQQGLADAYVAYYGIGIEHLAGDLARIDAPLLMHFGADDSYAPPTVVAGFAKRLGSQAALHSYDGAGHAFYRPGKDPASDLSRQRSLAFLPRTSAA